MDAGSAATFEQRVQHDLEPYNVAGLCDPAKLNLYPYVYHSNGPDISRRRIVS